MKGCRLLSPACIRDDVLDIVDAHFAQFGNGISGLFGSAAATPKHAYANAFDVSC